MGLGGIRNGGLLVRRTLGYGGLVAAVLLLALVLPGVVLASGSVAWSVRGVALPSRFAPGGLNRYEVLALNSGSLRSEPGVTVTDTLPAGLTLAGVESREGAEGGVWSCSEPPATVVVCTLGEELEPGAYAPALEIEVSSPTESAVPLVNEVTVSGGGAVVSQSVSESTLVSSAPQPFGVTDFGVDAHNADGTASVLAGGHPWEITTSLGFPWQAAPPNVLELHYRQVHNVKKIAVELPAGMVGNLISTTEHCTQIELHENACPEGSRVGELAIAGGSSEFAVFQPTGPSNNPSGVFNMVPEPGYPAQLGLSDLNQPIYLDVTVVHTPGGERARLTTVAVPPILEAGDVMLTLWGEPGAFNEGAPFTEEPSNTETILSNPSSCTEKPVVARVEAESWGEPGVPVFAEAPVYPEISGCAGLFSGFAPALSLSPLPGVEGTSTADSPSGFQGAASVPQTTGFERPSTADVRDVSVALPLGLSVSPAAAQGLVGCQERGPEGINLGTTQIGPGGVDEGNPEATEYGAGHAGGNASPYDDAQYHTAPGHCPDASIIGSVEVFTPLLENRCGASKPACGEGESPAPLQGHAFIAQPKCGGSGQAACTGADAEDGVLFSGYVELSGDGVLIKERATIAVNQATGQMTLELRELPEFPFNEIKIHAHGGSRAPLATPQTCGAAATTSVWTPWSATGPGEAFMPLATSFNVDSDGAGGACPATWPYTPGFSGESLTTTAGGHTTFTTTLTRHDREQNPTSLNVIPPLGLLALLSNVTPCPEPLAAQGACPASSLIGHDTAGAGSGPTPLYVTGNVYLTGPYKGAPFGLDVLTPAVAGPFNLGNINVRATINVDPNTAQVTITSDPFPQSQLGVPLRLKVLNITIDKENFVINPTNGSQQQVTATTTGNQGTTANLSTPFTVTGAASLPSNPVFKASIPGKASKRNGATLTVTVTSTPGQAGLKSVKVDLPKQLPSRQATYALACTATQFTANPAGCPPGSAIGTSTLTTPILKTPMTGPIYLVSHGGAAFPDLVFVLQAEGITIDLTGNTNVKHGITSQTFTAIPDAPFTSFTATLPAGPHSILTANLPKKNKFNFCGQHLNMPIHTTAQNNKQTTKITHITITGCKHPHKHHKAKAKHTRH